MNVLHDMQEDKIVKASISLVDLTLFFPGLPKASVDCIIFVK